MQQLLVNKFFLKLIFNEIDPQEVLDQPRNHLHNSKVTEKPVYQKLLCFMHFNVDLCSFCQNKKKTCTVFLYPIFPIWEIGPKLIWQLCWHNDLKKLYAFPIVKRIHGILQLFWNVRNGPNSSLSDTAEAYMRGFEFWFQQQIHSVDSVINSAHKTRCVKRM